MVSEDTSLEMRDVNSLNSKAAFLKKILKTNCDTINVFDE